MDLLPPRISDPELFALVADILATRVGPEENAALRLRLIEKNMPWQALADLADAQGALAPFVWALMQRSLLLPLPLGTDDHATSHHPTAQLTMAYRHHIARRQRQRDQVVGIISALNREQIYPLLLKGARYLLAPAGSWGEARDMRDIDLLVHADEAERTIAVLAAQGYAADPRPMPIHQHLPEMWHAAYPSAVEIHTEALAYPARKSLTTDHVWRRGTRLTIEQVSGFVLPAEWHLLHGLLHHQISDRGHVRGILAVKPLWEFAMLGRDVSEAGWKSIADHMAARGQADVLGSWTLQAARLYGPAVPQVIDISPAARAHAQATLDNAGAPGWLRRARFLADQLRFGFAPDTLSARYGLPAADVSLWTTARHLRFLVHRYRRGMRNRLFGPRGR